MPNADGLPPVTLSKGTIRVNARSRREARILSRKALCGKFPKGSRLEFSRLAPLLELAERNCESQLLLPDSGRPGAWEVEMLFVFDFGYPQRPISSGIHVQSCIFASERPHDHPDIVSDPEHWVAIALAFDERAALERESPMPSSTHRKHPVL